MARTRSRSARLGADLLGLLVFVVCAFPVYWMVNSSLLPRRDQATCVGGPAGGGSDRAAHAGPSWRSIIRTYGAVSTTVRASMKIATAADMPNSPPPMPRR